jgi:putative endonuclease
MHSRGGLICVRTMTETELSCKTTSGGLSWFDFAHHDKLLLAKHYTSRLRSKFFLGKMCDKFKIWVLISMKLYYLYLLEGCDGSYYTVITHDLSRRVIEHQQGLIRGCYTYSRRSVRLLHYLIFNSTNDAIYFEKKVKRWS